MEFVISRGSTNLASGAATEAKQDDQIALLDEIKSGIESNGATQATGARQDDQTALLTEIATGTAPPAGLNQYVTLPSAGGGTGLERLVQIVATKLLSITIFLDIAVADAKYALIFDSNDGLPPSDGDRSNFTPIPLVAGQPSSMNAISASIPFTFTNGIKITLSTTRTYTTTSSATQAAYLVQYAT